LRGIHSLLLDRLHSKAVPGTTSAHFPLPAGFFHSHRLPNPRVHQPSAMRAIFVSSAFLLLLLVCTISQVAGQYYNYYYNPYSYSNGYNNYYSPYSYNNNNNYYNNYYRNYG
jgi:hypothetical protein